MLPLSAITAGQRPLVGGKAANLAGMSHDRLPVPEGFCLTSAAFDQFLAACPEHGEVSAALANLSPGRPGGAAAASRRVLACLAKATMPEAVAAAVLKAWQELGGDRAYAVRSSATVEDAAEHSFAGQFESFLNVRGQDALLKAIQTCWRSLYTERTLAYQVRNGLPPDKAAMAVIVQAMVPAEIAGVLFTMDPVSGNPGRVVLEGTPGLGDRLVSGQVNPDHMVLDKATLRIISHQKPDVGGCVDEALARRLGKLARQVEHLFGGPQDIEWAQANGDVFLLQARPVTTVRRARRHEDADAWADRQVWSNLNTGEVLPDVMTPVTWSMIRRLMGRIAGGMFRLVGADMNRAPILDRVAGRAYFNKNTVLAALKPFSWLLKRSPDFFQALGGGQKEDHRQGLLDIPDEALPDLGFRWPNYILSWPRCVASLITHSPGRGDAWTIRLKAHQDALAQVDLESMSAPALGNFFEQVLQDGLLGMDLLYLVTQGMSAGVFQYAFCHWLDEPDATLAYRFFAGLGGMPETEGGLALWRLAALAHADEETESLLLADDGWTSLRPKLQPTEPGRQFLASWDAFMKEHGHHCRGEMELFNARWFEMPDYILGIMRGYLRTIDQSDPIAKQRRLAEERRELTEHCRSRLKNPVKRWLFSRSLRRAQKLAVNREEWKNQAVRQITILRRVLLSLGDRLVQEGRLARPDDVFFLEVTEVKSVANGAAAFALGATITKRREEYERNLALAPPPVVVGRYDPSTPVAPEAPADATVLTGIPVFPGTVTGRARVIARANDHDQVLPGEILVAPFTDPAWTPYFVSAAGVVMDQGGVLSHGSIVAREYGLPAVTNVASATQVITTGDLIQVDGAAGRVVILERAAAPEG